MENSQFHPNETNTNNITKIVILNNNKKEKIFIKTFFSGNKVSNYQDFNNNNFEIQNPTTKIEKFLLCYKIKIDNQEFPKDDFYETTIYTIQNNIIYHDINNMNTNKSCDIYYKDYTDKTTNNKTTQLLINEQVYELHGRRVLVCTIFGFFQGSEIVFKGEQINYIHGFNIYFDSNFKVCIYGPGKQFRVFLQKSIRPSPFCPDLPTTIIPPLITPTNLLKYLPDFFSRIDKNNFATLISTSEKPLSEYVKFFDQNKNSDENNIFKMPFDLLKKWNLKLYETRKDELVNYHTYLKLLINIERDCHSFEKFDLIRRIIQNCHKTYEKPEHFIFVISVLLKFVKTNKVESFIYPEICRVHNSGIFSNNIYGHAFRKLKEIFENLNQNSALFSCFSS
jgi:hypothetical protein